MKRYHWAWVWRGDIAKFFNSMDHTVLRTCLERRVHDPKAQILLDKVLSSPIHNGQSVSQSRSCGLPIGNLTSQILANVYLNEFDRFVQHSLKPLAYIRYGDDFIGVGKWQGFCS